MTYYKDRRPIGGEPILIVADRAGNIVNRNPSKDELKGLKGVPREYYKIKRKRQSYTIEELLNELRRFEKEHRRSPTEEDFRNNPEYPYFTTYVKIFGSWFNSLKLAELNIDIMGPQSNTYRGRQAEIEVIDHFKRQSVDLSGENHNSHCDGICILR